MTTRLLWAILAVQAPFAAWVAADAAGDRLTTGAILGVLMWLVANLVLLLGYTAHLLRRHEA